MTYIADARLASRPPRDSSLDNVMRNAEIVNTMFGVLGMPHPGQDENPRPMNELSLYDLKSNANRSLASATSVAPDEAFHYCFYADRYRSDPRQAIAVPRDHLWWLAAPIDTVLLSDRTTHHITSILRVDRDNERIYFSDPWPDLFFLLPGKNSLGIAAQKGGGLSVSKDEFLKAVVGLVTLDTNALAQNYLAAFPARDTVETNLRLGLNVVDADRESVLISYAVDHFNRARQLAARDDDSTRHKLASAMEWMARVCRMYGSARRGDTATATTDRVAIDELLTTSRETELKSELIGDDFGRMGCAAGFGQDFAAAIHYFDMGLEVEPELERVWMLRASANLALGRHEEAIANATRALELNDRSRAGIKTRRVARDSRDGFGRGLDDTEINRLDGLRMQSLSIRLKAALAGDRHDLVMQDGPALEAYTEALSERAPPA